MIPYILHVALLISICLLFYKIFLQRETFYKLNRLILLTCLALSFALPLITIPEAWTLRAGPDTAAIKTEAQQAPQMDAVIKAQVQKQVLDAQKQVQAQTISKAKQVKTQSVATAIAPAKTQAAPVVIAKDQPTIVEQA